MSLQLSEKQNSYILDANARYNFKIGAVRSGKSFVDTAFIIPERLRERSGLAGLNLILGVSKESIERNVLEPMREIYTDKLIGNIKSGTNIAMICGEPVYCLGAEKITQVAKIQGASVKYCYGDEIAKWNKEVFEMLKSRLDKDYSCMDGACNPETPEHWFKKFIDREDLDIFLQHYTIFDNPFLPKQFVQNLCKEYEGTVYYDRLILGDWKKAEGLIFPHYQSALGKCPFVLTKNTFKKMSDFQISIDYGTMNAFACLLWVKIGEVWWAWRGYYYSGRETGEQLTDSQYADAVCDLVMPLFQIQFDKINAGELEVAQKLTTIIDPSAASFIAELRKRKIFKVRKADNAVGDGIRETNTAIKCGLIRVDEGIEEWKSEAGGYVWDEDSEEEKPIKVGDHYMDATRYFVKTNKITKDIEKRIPTERPEDYSYLLGYSGY